jgi:hypothetical protein
VPSLRELQQGFADAVFSDDGEPPFATVPAANGAQRIAIYRTAVFANYRNALGATYPVMKRLVGAPFFNTAVDAYVKVHASTSGDLNVYGDAFGAFLEGYPPAAGLAYLPDVARLEWAIDEASRAPDFEGSPTNVLAAFADVPPERLPALRLDIAPSCRLVASAYPILRIWQVNQNGYDGDDRVSLDEGADAILVRRDAHGVSLTRTAAGERAWLEALAAGATLGVAIDAAQDADATFDLSSALRTRIADSTIMSVNATQV